MLDIHEHQQSFSVIYPTDLSDSQWELIQINIPEARDGGRPRKTSMRAVLNAIFFINRSGCAWRYLPQEIYPPWQTVYRYFREWRRVGIFKAIHDCLVKLCRTRGCRCEKPSAAMIDSQSVKCQFGEMRSFDGFKKVRGRKRHIITDTNGFLLGILITGANSKDHKPAIELMNKDNKDLSSLEALYVDGGYRANEFLEHVKNNFNFEPTLRIASMIKKDDRSRPKRTITATNLKPIRWIVERTFAWLNHFRRLSRDYERTIESSLNMVFVAMTQLMLNRLIPNSIAKNYWKNRRSCIN